MDERISGLHAKLTDSLETSIQTTTLRLQEQLQTAQELFAQQKPRAPSPEKTQTQDAIREIRQTVRELVRTSQDDIESTSQLLARTKASLQKDFAKLLGDRLAQSQDQWGAQLAEQLQDKVRVDEVQGALRKMTEDFKAVVQQMDEVLQGKIQESAGRAGQRYEAVIEKLLRQEQERIEEVKMMQDSVQQCEREVELVKIQQKQLS